MGRWTAAVVVGLVLATPLAWLLAHAAFLPFFLGLFFFVLFGLVIGASMHRVAAPGRPYATLPILLGTTLVVLWAWGFSIHTEYRNFPKQRARETVSDPRLDLGGRSVGEYRGMVEQNVRVYLDREFRPGGMLGYLRFVVTDGTLPKAEVGGTRRNLRAAHRGYIWVSRAVLSVGLLAFGVASQTMLLRLKRDPAVRAIDLDHDALPAGRHVGDQG